MDRGVVEIRDEIRRLNDRFYVALLLDTVTRCCRRRFRLDLKETSDEHVAGYWAYEFNLLAHLCFLTVMTGVVGVPVVVEQMRRAQQDLDIKLGLGIVCLSISLSFLAYLRWFVVA